MDRAGTGHSDLEGAAVLNAEGRCDEFKGAFVNA